MLDPLLLVVSGQKLAEKVQALFNAKDVAVLPFESGEYFPGRLRGCIAVIPDVRVAGGHRVDRCVAWLDDMVEPRIPGYEPKKRQTIAI